MSVRSCMLSWCCAPAVRRGVRGCDDMQQSAHAAWVAADGLLPADVWAVLMPVTALKCTCHE